MGSEIYQPSSEEEEQIVLNVLRSRTRYAQPGVNFTKILQAAFSYKSVLSSFSLLRRHRVVFFCQKEIGAESAHKMLVTLTAGVNFTNILQAAFLYARL